MLLASTIDGTNMSSSMDGECSYREPLDDGWLLLCGVFVLTMQAGFGFVEAGSVRINNAVNIMAKNFFDMAICAMTFWAVGYGIAYGRSLGGVIGSSSFFPDEDSDFGFFFFQMTFAATASTINSGASAERMDFKTYCCLSACITTMIYPVAAHWVWNDNGFLKQLGFVDLAGGSVVHLLGGTSGLVLTYRLGPRLGVLGSDIPKELECVASSLTLSHHAFQGESVYLLFGAMLLSFGWIAFNAGSSLQLTSFGHIVASHVAAHTMLGGCAGMLTGVIFGARFNERNVIKPGDISNGVLGGLVSITAGAHLLTGLGSIMVGACGGVIAVGGSILMSKIKIDDPVGVVPVHLLCGMWSILATGLFANPTKCSELLNPHFGAVFGNPRLLGVQIAGLLVIFAWTFVTTNIALFVISKCLRRSIRIGPVHELCGNDVVEHGIDLFKRLKHTYAMQKVMAKMRSNTANSGSSMAAQSTLLEQVLGGNASLTSTKAVTKGVPSTTFGKSMKVRPANHVIPLTNSITTLTAKGGTVSVSNNTGTQATTNNVTASVAPTSMFNESEFDLEAYRRQYLDK